MHDINYITPHKVGFLLRGYSPILSAHYFLISPLSLVFLLFFIGDFHLGGSKVNIIWIFVERQDPKGLG